MNIGIYLHMRTVLLENVLFEVEISGNKTHLIFPAMSAEIDIDPGLLVAGGAIINPSAQIIVRVDESKRATASDNR